MWKYFPPSDGQELRGAFAITILRLGVSVRVLMLDALEKENHVHSTYDSVTNIYMKMVKIQYTHTISGCLNIIHYSVY